MIRRVRTARRIMVGENFVDIQDEEEFLPRLGHTAEKIDVDIGAECRRRHYILGWQFGDLAYRVGDNTHDDSFLPELRLDDNDTTAVGYGTRGQTEFEGEIDDRDHVAAKVDDTTDGLRCLGNLGENAVRDDFFHLKDTDGVLLLGQLKRQILRLLEFFCRFIHEASLDNMVLGQNWNDTLGYLELSYIPLQQGQVSCECE